MVGSRIGQLAVITACGALSASVLFVPSAAAAPRAAAPHWRVVAQTPPTHPGFLYSIIAPSPTSAYALGFGLNGTAPSFPIGRHWNGRRWSMVRWPASLNDNGISCAGASSPTDVWAFSGAGGHLGNGPPNAAALRLVGFRWVVSRILSSAPVTAITGCNVLGPADVWVFGGAFFGIAGPIGTWHLTRSGWRQANTGKVQLIDASVVSDRDIWAGGGEYAPVPKVAPIVARWNGSSWRVIGSVGSVLPSPTNSTMVYIDAIRALSATDVWARAVSVNFVTPAKVFVVHWNGQRWSRVKPGSPGYYLPAAVSDGHGGWWSAPYPATSPDVRYLLHRVGSQWTKVQLPAADPLVAWSVSFVHVPHSQAMLAVGTTEPTGRPAVGVVLAFGTLPQ
jgi:hypothetical protein